MVAVYTQASFTEAGYVAVGNTGLKTAKHSGETKAPERRPGGCLLCLFFLVGNATQVLVHTGQGLWAAPVMWENS